MTYGVTSHPRQASTVPLCVPIDRLQCEQCSCNSPHTAKPPSALKAGTRDKAHACACFSTARHLHGQRPCTQSRHARRARARLSKRARMRRSRSSGSPPGPTAAFTMRCRSSSAALSSAATACSSTAAASPLPACATKVGTTQGFPPIQHATVIYATVRACAVGRRRFRKVRAGGAGWLLRRHHPCSPARTGAPGSGVLRSSWGLRGFCRPCLFRRCSTALFATLRSNSC